MAFSRLSGWFRLLIFLSALWIVGAFIYVLQWFQKLKTSGSLGQVEKFDRINWDNFLLIGLFPVIVVWGIIWVVQGFRHTQIRPNLRDDEKRQEELDKRTLF